MSWLDWLFPPKTGTHVQAEREHRATDDLRREYVRASTRAQRLEDELRRVSIETERALREKGVR